MPIESAKSAAFQFGAIRDSKGLVLEEMTFGKLYSAKREPPEDLHVTSRSRGIDDTMLAGLQLDELFKGQGFSASRIDPQSTAAGVFLIRPLDSRLGAATHMALVRIRFRDHISLSGARRTYPQIVASVVKIDEFQNYPERALEEAAKKKAERVSMDEPMADRFDFVPEPVGVVQSPRPQLTDGNIEELAPLLAVLVPDPLAKPEQRMSTFGARDFPDEAAFLAALGRALRHRPDLKLLKRLSVVVGFGAEFPGSTLRYLPSQQSPPVSLGASQLRDLRRRVNSIDWPLRLLAPVAARSSAVLARTAKAPIGASRTHLATTWVETNRPRSVERPARPAGTRAASDRSGLAKLFLTTLADYRSGRDWKIGAEALFGFLTSSSFGDEPLDDILENGPRFAWLALQQYAVAPRPDAKLGLLFDGAVFQHDRIGEGHADAIADAWFNALNEKLWDTIIVLSGYELEVFDTRGLPLRLKTLKEGWKTEQVWQDSRDLAEGRGGLDFSGDPQKRLSDVERARRSVDPAALGVCGLVNTNLDTMERAPKSSGSISG